MAKPETRACTVCETELPIDDLIDLEPDDGSELYVCEVGLVGRHINE